MRHLTITLADLDRVDDSTFSSPSRRIISTVEVRALDSFGPALISHFPPAGDEECYVEEIRDEYGDPLDMIPVGHGKCEVTGLWGDIAIYVFPGEHTHDGRRRAA